MNGNVQKQRGVFLPLFALLDFFTGVRVPRLFAERLYF